MRELWLDAKSSIKIHPKRPKKPRTEQSKCRVRRRQQKTKEGAVECGGFGPVISTVAVILLSLLGAPGGTAHGNHANPKPKPNPRPRPKPEPDPVAVKGVISLYIQRSPRLADAEAKIPSSSSSSSSRKIVVFDQPLTDGPENTSRVIGRAQGFMLPGGLLASSGFNVFNLNLNSSAYKGSLSIQGKRQNGHQAREELPVVGGTGHFAFAGGFAVFTPPNLAGAHSAIAKPLYRVKLHLRFRR